MSYSQFGQDQFVMSYYQGLEKGYFIDVGASKDGNDTRVLEELGWGGICIEPINESFENLIKIRKCKCLNVCVGNEEKEVDFMQNDGYTTELSGVSDFYCEEHRNRIKSEQSQMGGDSKIIKKVMKTLSSIMAEEGSPDFIEWLKIDVEGGEKPVIEGVDFDNHTFGLISIEANYQKEFDDCCEILKRNGYEPFHRVGIDVFFARVR